MQGSWLKVQIILKWNGSKRASNREKILKLDIDILKPQHIVNFINFLSNIIISRICLINANVSGSLSGCLVSKMRSRIKFRKLPSFYDNSEIKLYRYMAFHIINRSKFGRIKFQLRNTFHWWPWPSGIKRNLAFLTPLQQQHNSRNPLAWNKDTAVSVCFRIKCLQW